MKVGIDKQAYLLYTPLIMKSKLLLVAIILALSGVGIGAYTLGRTENPVEAQQEKVTVIDLFNEVNAQRRLADVPELMLDPKLNQSACDKELSIVDTGGVTHDGYEAYIDKYAPGSTRIGENLGHTNIGTTSVVTAWMNSPTHRDNILMPDYRRVGYCIGTLEFEYLGRYGLINIVQHFAN